MWNLNGFKSPDYQANRMQFILRSFEKKQFDLLFPNMATFPIIILLILTILLNFTNPVAAIIGMEDRLGVYLSL